MPDILIRKIDAAVVPLMWSEIIPHLERAIAKSNGEFTEKGVFDSICSGDTLLYVVYKDDTIISAITLDRRVFDSGKEVLVISMAAGSELDLWMDEILEIADQVAKDSKCEDVYVVGRAGWKKHLCNKGYDVAHTVYSKKVI